MAKVEVVDGFRVLGAPIWSETFCSTFLDSTLRKVTSDSQDFRRVRRCPEHGTSLQHVHSSQINYLVWNRRHQHAQQDTTIKLFPLELEQRHDKFLLQSAIESEPLPPHAELNSCSPPWDALNAAKMEFGLGTTRLAPNYHTPSLNSSATVKPLGHIKLSTTPASTNAEKKWAMREHAAKIQNEKRIHPRTYGTAHTYPTKVQEYATQRDIYGIWHWWALHVWIQRTVWKMLPLVWLWNGSYASFLSSTTTTPSYASATPE